MITLAADVGGTRIKLGLAREGRVLARKAINADSHLGLRPLLPKVESAFTELLDTSGHSLNECISIGIAFPSLIDASTGRILNHFGKFKDAPSVDLREWSQQTFGLPLHIDNDARTALLGEWNAGAGRGSDDIVMMTLGTGIGVAAMMQGELVRGQHHQAAILGGHISVRYDGRECTCGNRGCAEAEASTAALPNIARQRDDFLTSPLRAIETINYEAVFRFAREGDACCVALRQQAIDVWSALLISLVHVFDPERIIVGGGVIAGAGDFFPELSAAVQSRAMTPWGKLQITLAQLGDDAALIGCERLAIEGAAK